MGSRAVGKCETLLVSLLRDKANLALLCSLGDSLNLTAKEKAKTKQHKTHGAKGFLFSLVDCPRFWYREVKEGRILAQETQIFICFICPSLRQRTNIGRLGKNEKTLIRRITIVSF